MSVTRDSLVWGVGAHEGQLVRVSETHQGKQGGHAWGWAQCEKSEAQLDEEGASLGEGVWAYGRVRKMSK